MSDELDDLEIPTEAGLAFQKYSARSVPVEVHRAFIAGWKGAMQSVADRPPSYRIGDTIRLEPDLRLLTITPELHAASRNKKEKFCSDI